MKTTLLLIAACCLIPSTLAHAGVKEKAVELLKVMEIRKQIDGSMDQMTGFAGSMIDSQEMDPESKAKAKKMAESSMAASLGALRSIEWESIFADIYAEVFTEDELQGLIDFYQSPVGKKFLDKQPQLMSATMQRMQIEMAKVMPQIQDAARKAIEEASKEKEAE